MNKKFIFLYCFLTINTLASCSKNEFTTAKNTLKSLEYEKDALSKAARKNPSLWLKNHTFEKRLSEINNQIRKAQAQLTALRFDYTAEKRKTFGAEYTPRDHIISAGFEE